MDDMYLEIIILSLLRHGPVHGYELKQRVRRISLNDLSNNSLYPALRRFEQRGLATVSIEAQDGRPPRKVYAITQAGREYFTSMISSLPASVAGEAREFLVRVSFFGEIHREQRREILRSRDSVLADQIGALQTLSDEPSRSMDVRWKRASITGYITSMQAERRWIAGLVEMAEE